MACVPPEELAGYGSLLEYKNPLTDAWVTVAGTKDLSLPNRTRGTIDTTDGQSGGWRKRIPGVLKEQAAVSYEMKFLKAQWFVLHNLFDDGLLVDWRVVLMDERQFYYQFCGFITDMGDEIPMEELVMSTIEITPSGAPTSGYLN